MVDKKKKKKFYNNIMFDKLIYNTSRSLTEKISLDLKKLADTSYLLIVDDDDKEEFELIKSFININKRFKIYYNETEYMIECQYIYTNNIIEFVDYDLIFPLENTLYPITIELIDNPKHLIFYPNIGTNYVLNFFIGGTSKYFINNHNNITLGLDYDFELRIFSYRSTYNFRNNFYFNYNNYIYNLNRFQDKNTNQYENIELFDANYIINNNLFQFFVKDNTSDYRTTGISYKFIKDEIEKIDDIIPIDGYKYFTDMSYNSTNQKDDFLKLNLGYKYFNKINEKSSWDFNVNYKNIFGRNIPNNEYYASGGYDIRGFEFGSLLTSKQLLFTSIQYKYNIKTFKYLDLWLNFFIDYGNTLDTNKINNETDYDAGSFGFGLIGIPIVWTDDDCSFKYPLPIKVDYALQFSQPASSKTQNLSFSTNF